MILSLGIALKFILVLIIPAILVCSYLVKHPRHLALCSAS
jgi:hypothetical protein